MSKALLEAQKIADRLQLKEEGNEFVSDELLDNLKGLRDKITFEPLVLAKLVLACADQLWLNLHRFQSPDRLSSFLSRYDFEPLRDSVYSYAGGEVIGDYYLEHWIRMNVSENREAYMALVNVFFAVCGEDL